MSTSPPPRIRYRVELLVAVPGEKETVIKTASVRGYRPTVHRAALKLLEWHCAQAYQLRRIRDDSITDRREVLK